MAETDEFKLGEPVLVCRWRMRARTVPLLNRHMRALSQRRVADEPVARGLISWAKQHVEWSLADDTTVEVPDEGVLMLVVDDAGRAAMSVGPYTPLEETSRAALAARACTARIEARETGVAPEVLCAATGEGLVVGAAADERLAGAVTLAVQLARTKGFAVSFDEGLAARALADADGALAAAQAGDAAADVDGASAPGDAVRGRVDATPGCGGVSDDACDDVSGAAWLLVSDEHGVVPASGAEAPSASDELVALLRDGYETLLARAGC